LGESLRQYKKSYLGWHGQPIKRERGKETANSAEGKRLNKRNNTGTADVGRTVRCGQVMNARKGNKQRGEGKTNCQSGTVRIIQSHVGGMRGDAPWAKGEPVDDGPGERREMNRKGKKKIKRETGKEGML